jgi:4-hydroxy-3-polyprenylbenzoate decarboxylase
MAYKSLQECIDDLDKSGQLIRIKEEVDPYLRNGCHSFAYF